MKKILFLTIILALSNVLTGCGSSKQYVVKPDINAPINNQSESIIHLKRADYHLGKAGKPDVIANDKIIGQIANDDELAWKTKSNSLECIALNNSSKFKLRIILDDTPLSYKCFMTKPQEVLSLTYDLYYPGELSQIRRSILPIYKDVNKPQLTKPIAVTSISSKVQTPTDEDIRDILNKAITKQFRENIVENSSHTIDLEILNYKTGNAGLRWLGSSMKGTTLVEIKVTLKEDDEVIDTFVTRPVITEGGFLTVGADTDIFNDAAEDIFLQLFGPRQAEKDEDVGDNLI